MEYSPRYPQPFTLTQAIALDPAVAWDEIARLNNSLLHLKRSQIELQQYLQESALGEGSDLEVNEALKENEITIASQDERVFMLKLALTHHGYSVASSEQTKASPATHPEGTGTARSQPVIGSNSNDFQSSGTESADTTGRENGVYL